jgi:hypothetical protein
LPVKTAFALADLKHGFLRQQSLLCAPALYVLRRCQDMGFQAGMGKDEKAVKFFIHVPMSIVLPERVPEKDTPSPEERIMRYYTCVVVAIGVLLSVSIARAKTVTECYQYTCATVSVPECIAPGNDFEIYVEGSIDDNNSFLISSYGLYENAKWNYTNNHMVDVMSGTVIDEDGFSFGNTYTNTYIINKPDGVYSYTFVFGPRGFGHDYYDVSVDITVSVGESTKDVALDVKPGSCPNPINVKKKGVLPIVLVGSEDFDVTQVDPATIELIGVSPIDYSYEDVTAPYPPFTGKESMTDCTEAGPDGMLDLALKFETEDVIEALENLLGREPLDGEEILLSVTGELIGAGSCGSSVYGEDVVVILHNEKINDDHNKRGKDDSGDGDKKGAKDDADDSKKDEDHHGDDGHKDEARSHH